MNKQFSYGLVLGILLMSLIGWVWHDSRPTEVKEYRITIQSVENYHDYKNDGFDFDVKEMEE